VFFNAEDAESAENRKTKRKMGRKLNCFEE